MREYRAEMLAVSRAGHDKDTIYVVLAADNEYFWLADGKRRLLESPKKKKQKHVQVIKNLPQQMIEQMQSITMDAHIRKILTEYRRVLCQKQMSLK